MPYTIPHAPTSASASIVENDVDEDMNERPHGDQFKIGEGVDQELGARVSKFPGLLPGEVAKRLKAAVLGRKADNPDESDDEDDSPVTDSARIQSGKTDGKKAENGLDERLSETMGSIRSRSQNYNTFGWDSDTERGQSVTDAR